MDRDNREEVKRAAKTILTAGLIMVATFCVVFGFYYSLHAAQESDWRLEKQCYKELNRMIRASPPGQAMWVEKTMQAEKDAFNGTRFCRALELVHESDVVDN
jgi:hypothetical protein